MSRLVIDSSVVIKWFVPEVGSDIADQVLELYKEKTLKLLVPNLFFAEIGNIIWKKCRLQALDPDDGQAIISAIRMIQFDASPASELLAQAYRLATNHQRTVYDALYLALSLGKNAPFLTADRRLVHAVSPALPNVISLDDWPLVKANLDSSSDR